MLFLLSFRMFDKKILPAAMAVSHIEAKGKANRIIDQALSETLRTMDISSESLYLENTGGVSANTMLINAFCSSLSMGISDALMEIGDEEIQIPIGALSGFTIFSNMGPDIRFTMRPMGDAAVDYETAFSSVGINQTNYQIWIHIRINVQIVNPLTYEVVSMERKVMLLDTVIKGEVPSEYLDFSGRKSE